MTSQSPEMWIISIDNTYGEKAGNATYLDAIAAALAGQGAQLRLLISDAVNQDRARFRIAASSQRLYRKIYARRHVRLGEWFYCYDPRTIWRWFRHRFGLKRPVQYHGHFVWRLNPPAPGGRRWIRKILKRHEARAVIANYFHSAEVFDADYRPHRVAILCHDILKMRGDSLRAANQRLDFDPDMIDREARVFSDADVIIAIQASEGEWLAKTFPLARVVLAPHPVESAEQGRQGGDAPPMAIFVGSTNGPNLDGMRWFLDDVWPRVTARLPQAELHAVGGICQLDNWPVNSVRHGFVDSVAPYYRMASVAVVPIRFGSGLKIKLVEALGFGVPVIATTSATEGLPACHPDVIRIADDADAFAASLVQMLSVRNPDTQAEIDRFITANFASATIARRILDTLDDSNQPERPL